MLVLFHFTFYVFLVYFVQDAKVNCVYKTYDALMHCSFYFSL